MAAVSNVLLGCRRGRRCARSRRGHRRRGPVQEKAIREWAKSVGHKIVRWKREEGESGSNGPDTREGRAGGLSGGAEAVGIEGPKGRG